MKITLLGLKIVNFPGEFDSSKMLEAFKNMLQLIIISVIKFKVDEYKLQQHRINFCRWKKVKLILRNEECETLWFDFYSQSWREIDEANDICQNVVNISTWHSSWKCNTNVNEIFFFYFSKKNQEINWVLSRRPIIRLRSFMIMGHSYMYQKTFKVTRMFDTKINKYLLYLLNVH